MVLLLQVDEQKFCVNNIYQFKAPVRLKVVFQWYILWFLLLNLVYMVFTLAVAEHQTFSIKVKVIISIFKILY